MPISHKTHTETKMAGFSIRTMKIARLNLATLLVAVLLAAQSPYICSQQQKLDALNNQDIVTFPVVVKDRTGKVITDLGENDFLVSEDKVPQKIEFVLSPQAPQSVLVVLDTSGTMRTNFREIQERTIGFINSASSTDPIAVVTFSEKNVQTTEFTMDRNNSIEAIRRVSAWGNTPLYQMIAYAFDNTLKLAPPRTAVLLVTDGLDNSSSKTKLDLPQKRTYPIYCLCPRFPLEIFISQNLPREAESAARQEIEREQQNLRKLCESTGGIIIENVEMADLDGAFRKISLELDGQYTLGYYSTNPRKDGKFRKSEVKAKSTDYVVRTRSGYFADAAIKK